MRGRRILMPAKTVAEWGGLHEYVVNASRTLVEAGNDVVVVCRPGLVAERVAATGATALEVDWDNWQPTADLIRDTMAFDAILSHGPGPGILPCASTRPCAPSSTSCTTVPTTTSSTPGATPSRPSSP
jgi:hypothetical protein